MAIDDNESCGSRAAEPPSSPKHSWQQKQRFEVFSEVLSRLKDSNLDEVQLPGFEDQLWLHFNRLPARYVLDVNVERAEDVLMHKRLLNLAEDPDKRPALEVRLVQVHPTQCGASQDSIDTVSTTKEDALSSHPPPTFGSSPNLQALELHDEKACASDVESDIISTSQTHRHMHEITFSTVDKPKLLAQLTSILSEAGLNIEEAHVFSTTDGFSLDVFVVDGWPYEETEMLKAELQKKILKIKETPTETPCQTSSEPSSTGCVKIPTDGTDDWEIDARKLKFETKVASGTFGDLYKGTYCSQDVAIKVLKAEHLSSDLLKEFSQEVFILRKIRHKNVVQFIGACTRQPNLCIVTEFMSRGSVYNYLHKQKGSFKLHGLLKVAIDVSKGMSYLHQNKIIHRDLKTANLLMDEHGVVKVGDFGVARVQAQSGIMTAETGTYRWMAPEVIEHKPYDHRADVFSFGVVLWELLTGQVPYAYLTPLQAALGVVQQGMRPTIPKDAHPKLVELLERCWQQDPLQRPEFPEILEILQRFAKMVDDGEEKHKEKSIGSFFHSLRRAHH